MRYLINRDYHRVLSEEDRDILTFQDDSWTVESAELQAADQVKAYLRGYQRAQYDLPKIIIPVMAYDVGKTYAEGEHVTYQNGGATFIYVATQQTTGNLPTDNTYWGLGDNRPPMLVSVMVDLVVYDLFSHIMPDNIPEIRENRYKRAVKTLEEIRKGELDLDLPKLPEDDEETNLRFSTNKRRKWYW